MTRRLAAAGLVLLSIWLAACRSTPSPAPASDTPAPSSPTLAPIPPTATAAPTATMLPTATLVPATPTPVPPTSTPTLDATRAAEARIVTLTYPIARDPATLDPPQVLADDQAAMDVLGALFIRLTRYDPAGGPPRPWLAREWSFGENKVTFKLRDDVPWVHYNPDKHQAEPILDDKGQPRRVQAADVVAAVRHALDPKTADDDASLLYIIQGAQEYNTHAGTSPDKIGVRAVNPTTVEFQLTGSTAYMPAITALTMFTPLPQWALQQYGDAWTQPANLATNGPYTLAEWDKGKRLTLVRNAAYPDAASVAIERLRLPILPDASQAYALFTHGDVDTVAVPVSDYALARADTAHHWTLQAVPTGCTTFVGFTLDKLPMDNANLRKALAAAIDRQSLVEQIVKMDLPVTQLAPRGVFGASDEPGIVYDPDAARRYLAAAGFPNGQGLPPLTYAYNTCDSPTCKANQAVAEALRDMWQKTLNIEVKLQSFEWPAYLQKINHRTPVDQMPHAWRMAWCEDYPDANNWLYDAFDVNAPGNYSRTRPTQFDDLVAHAAEETDPAKRADLYHQAAHLLLIDEVRAAPLYTGAVLVASQPWLKRDYPIQGGQNFDQWTLDWAAKLKPPAP